MYGFVRNNSINRIDVLGMISRGDLTPTSGTIPRASYSCNCGWIDWGHANPKGPKRLWNNILSENGERSDAIKMFAVTYTQESSGLGITFNKASGSFWVKSSLGREEKKGVALAIFMLVTARFESAQLASSTERFTHSGWSEEDTISNLIAFYRAVEGYTFEDIRKMCDVLSPEASIKVWDQFYGKNGHVGKNKEWSPVLKDCDPCKNKNRELPAELQKIKPSPSSYSTWKEWGPLEG